MTDPHDHLERLVSEQADGRLTADERVEVDRAMAEQPGLRASAERYDRLRAVLADWRRLGGGIDWRAMAARVSERIGEEAALAASRELDQRIEPTAVDADVSAPVDDAARRQYQAVDRTVRAAAGRVPDVDWQAFRLRVSAAVRQEAALQAARRTPRAAGRSGWSRLAAFATPMAAAAAVVLAVLWWNGPKPGIDAGGGAVRAEVIVALHVPKSVGAVSIRFDESPRDVEPAPEDPAGGVIYAYGPSTWDHAGADWTTDATMY